MSAAELATRAARRPRAFGPARPDLRGARGLLLPLVLLLAWEGSARAGLFPSNLVPSPEAVVAEVAALAERGELWGHVWITVWRVFAGFLAGAAAATALGALTGYSRRLRALLDPTLQALKSVPSLSWVPLFILWLGIFETSKVALIAVGVFFPIYLNLMEGVQNVDRKLVEVGRIYGLSRLALIRRVLLPATLPAWFVGLRAGLALGWMFVVAAELMGASEGLGFLMVDGQMTGRPALIVASLILFAIAGKLTDWLLAALSARALGWQDSLGGRPMLRLEGVGKRFEGGLHALAGLSLEVEAGEIVGFVGASGCGKSTLLRLVSGLEAPSEGRLTLDGAAVSGPQAQIGFVFQEPRLMPWLSVTDNVRFGLHALPASEQRERAAEALDKVGLAGFAAALPRELSGGMAQRVAIARALARRPRVLALDEPFSALDYFTRLALQDHLLELWAAERFTVLLVTHDVEEAAYLSDRVLALAGRPGRIRREIAIAAPRPRRRASPALETAKEEILAAIGGG